VSCSWKQQPDKAQAEMSVPCSAFLRAEAAASFAALSAAAMIALVMLVLWGKKQEVVEEYGHVKR